MPIAARLHSVGQGRVPEMQAMAYTGTPAIVIGTILVYAAGFVAVGGADPTEIVGISLQAVDTNPGFSAANAPATTTGRSAKVNLIRPNDSTVFLATLTNNTSATVVPTQADVGVQYGVTAYSGIWTVDKNKTGGTARVEVVGFDDSIYGGAVYFKFLSAFLSNQ